MNLLSVRNDSHPKERPLADSVLHLIWREKLTSRADIARRMGLSRSTVSEIMNILIGTGLVAEIGSGVSNGGRRPIVISFQDESRCILGVDLGATHVSVALIDLRGRILVWQEKRHPVRSDPEGTRSLIVDLCDQCLKIWGKGNNRLIRIGVAVPSPVDPRQPKWLSEVVIPAWGGHSGLEQLQDRYGVPVHVDNDANLGAMAEHWWGAGQDVDDFVYIKMGHGIGAGYVLNGNVYRGADGVAGEFGHFPIDPDGALCVCGLRGCLVTQIGTPAIVERTSNLLGEYPSSSLANGNISIDGIEDAATAGDALALRVVTEVADHLGTAVAGWFNLMNPRLVILGGGLTRLRDLLTEPLRNRVQNCTLVSSAQVEIKTSALGSRGIALGAATLALQEALSDPDLVAKEQDRNLV